MVKCRLLNVEGNMSRVKCRILYVEGEKITKKYYIKVRYKEIARSMCLLGSIDYCYMSTFKLN
jgi:hypothetical protein